MSNITEEIGRQVSQAASAWYVNQNEVCAQCGEQLKEKENNGKSSQDSRDD